MTSQSTIPKKPAKPGTRPVGFRAQIAHGPPGKSANSTIPNLSNPVSSGPPSSAPVVTNKRNAPPMKKRNKGSGFLGLIFLVGFSALGYLIWTQLFQYESYGEIHGRVISVSTPWDGTVANWQVKEGEEVRQGQVLALISNLDMDHELAGFGDELKMNQARLEAEISKIRFDVQNHSERSQEAVAEYLKSYGELLSERAKCQELDRKFERTKQLALSNNVSRSAYEQIFFQLAGQKKKVDKLQDAVDVLKMRSNDANMIDDDGSSRLKPILAQIEVTQSKIARLRERINQGQIKAPVGGRITKRHRLTGESARSGEPVLDILEDNSIEAVLYVPQRIIDEFEVGKVVRINLEPYDQPLRCVVDRFGDSFQMAPMSIKRFYYEGQPLLPVYLTPEQDAGQVMSMRIGGTVKRPYEYRKAFGKMAEQVKTAFMQFAAPTDQDTPAVEANSLNEVQPLTFPERDSSLADLATTEPAGEEILDSTPHDEVLFQELSLVEPAVVGELPEATTLQIAD